MSLLSLHSGQVDVEWYDKFTCDVQYELGFTLMSLLVAYGKGFNELFIQQKAAVINADLGGKKKLKNDGEKILPT